LMPFREVLGKIVTETPGGIGAILVDDEGEAIDLFTRGDSYETKLAGAHHGIALGLIKRAITRNGNGNIIGAVSIRSDRYTFSIAPVQDGIFVVLIQDKDGIPALGMKALLDGIADISELI